MPTISFIGGGNMAYSLIKGLINSGVNSNKISVAEPSLQQRDNLTQQFAVTTFTDNTKVLSGDIIVLAVKPQLLQSVCQQIAPHINKKSLFISIAAGVTSHHINQWLGTQISMVRAMPNTPAQLQVGATGLFANTQVSPQQKNQAEKIMQAVGIVVWVAQEQQLNAVTAVSGSGPAYFFLLMEAMQQAGEQLGLDKTTCQQLVNQTALGAAQMAVQGRDSPAKLRAQVTSKGGTTEQAIESFQASNYQTIVSQALHAAYERSISLAEELGKK